MIAAEITLCIFLLIFTTVHSLSIIKIDNLNENQLLDKISHIIDHGGHIDRNKNQIHVRGNRKYLHDDTFKHKRVIKSIVEHGKEIEIESGKAIYKPLLRIHKHGTKLKEDNEANKGDLLRTDIKINILETLENEKEFEEEIQKNKAKIIKYVKSIWERLKAWKNKIKETRKGSKRTKYSLGSLDNKNDETSDLDATKYLRSSEIHYERRKPKNFFKIHGRTTRAPMPMAESASFWKYWVMSNPLTHNQCPDGAIKAGKKCINNADYV